MVFPGNSTHVDSGCFEKNREKGQSWKQWFLCLVVTFPFFTSAVQATFLKTTELRTIDLTDAALWSQTCQIGGAVIGALALCWIAERSGRKTAAISISFVQAVLCALLYFKSNTIIYLLSSIILGVCIGGIYTVLPIYVKEISENRTRGISVLILVLMKSLGDFFEEILNETDKGEFYAVIGGMIVQFLLLFFISETPSYFVKDGNIEAAEKTLAYIKGLDAKNDIVQTRLSDLLRENECAKSSGVLTLWGILKNQIWRDGFKIGLVLHSAAILGGSFFYLDYARVLAPSSVVFEKSLWAIAMPALALGAGVVAVAIVDVWERKYILTLSSAIITISLGVLGLYMRADMAPTPEPWVPTAALLATYCGHWFGWGVKWLVLVEIFNLQIRTKLVATLYVYSKLFELIVIHTFPYIEAYMGSFSIFYIFSGINLYAAVYIFFAMPLTKNRNIENIEKQMKFVPIWKQ